MDERRALLLTCDIQVEGVHFRLDRTTPYRVGRRAMAVISATSPPWGESPRTPWFRWDSPRIFPWIVTTGCSKGCGMNCCLTGPASSGGTGPDERLPDRGHHPAGRGRFFPRAHRGGARVGDRIFVTGHLGASGAGFPGAEGVREKRPREIQGDGESPRPAGPPGGPGAADLPVGRRLRHDRPERRGGRRPVPRVHPERVGAEIREDLLPLPERIGEIARKSGTPVLELALHSGEDYELLFTVPPGVSARRIRSLPGGSGIPVTEIGRIVTREEGYCLVDSRGREDR